MRVPIVVSVVVALVSSLAHAETWALQGSLPGPNGLEPGTVVISDQKIVAKGKDVALPAGARVIQVTGAILPGFIDLHNHLLFDAYPRWRPDRKFNNRYEWMETADYDRLLGAPEQRLGRSNDLACDAIVYAEVKALAGGATSVAGHLTDPACATGLVRNLDVASGFAKPIVSAACKSKLPDGYAGLPDVVVYEVYPMEIQRQLGDYYVCELRTGNLRSLIVHLAEGNPHDASAHREFKMLVAGDFLLPGLVILHGTALGAQDFADMNRAGVGLVWSPRSNDELYGGTANIPAARAAGLKIAIGPDWSPTGSTGILEEIGYAAAHYPAYFRAPQLLEMATSIPAEISRLDDRIGTLEPGHYADITVIGLKDGSLDSLGTATAADVQLVVVNGQPVYGEPSLVQRLLPTGSKLDPIPVCGTSKAVFLGDTKAGRLGRSWDDITTALQTQIGQTLGSIECDPAGGR
jgi:cytosine/adenosine deaminase-related metal-dependent hydrolase